LDVLRWGRDRPHLFSERGQAYMELPIAIVLLLIVGLGTSICSDLVTHRLPNWLTFGLAIAAISTNSCLGLWDGFIQSVLGLSVGLLCFLPFHLFGAMGAGDVKLLAAIGALIGPVNVFIAALMTILSGGLIAVFYIAARGGLRPMIRRYNTMLILLVALQPQYIPPAPGEAAGLRFPYALAIACGTVLAVAAL